jgi:hypothetical protein
MRTRFAVVVGSLLLLTGCFDMQFAITLERDLSGTLSMDMGVDMESMALMMATMERAFSGEEGPPTAGEIEAARQELLADMESEEPFNVERDSLQMAQTLPEGVELLGISQSRDGLKYSMGARFSFQHVDLLKDLVLDEEQQDPEAMGTENPVGHPFEGLQFVDEGSTYLLTTPPLDPYQDQVESGQVPLGQEELLQQMFQGLRFAFSVEAPFEVVEHNAHRVEGRRLIWEYDLASLQALQEDPAGRRIMVRFRK